MTDNTDLIARLEDMSVQCCDLAAVELRRLSARVAELEGALGIAAHQLSLQSQVWADDARAALEAANRAAGEP